MKSLPVAAHEAVGIIPAALRSVARLGNGHAPARPRLHFLKAAPQCERAAMLRVRTMQHGGSIAAARMKVAFDPGFGMSVAADEHAVARIRKCAVGSRLVLPRVFGGFAPSFSSGRLSRKEQAEGRQNGAACEFHRSEISEGEVFHGRSSVCFCASRRARSFA